MFTPCSVLVGLLELLSYLGQHCLDALLALHQLVCQCAHPYSSIPTFQGPVIVYVGVGNKDIPLRRNKDGFEICCAAVCNGLFAR